MSKLLAAWIVTLLLIGTVTLSAQPASASNGATFDFDLHGTSPNLSLDNNAPTAAAAKPGDSISINPVTAATGSAGTTIGSASQSRSLPQVSTAGFHLEGVLGDASCTGTTGTSPATTASCSTQLNHAANVLVVVNTAVAGTTTVSSVTVGTSSATALTGGAVNSGTSERTEVWYVFLTSSATDTVTVTFSGTVRGAMVAQSFTGTVTSEPFFDSTATITASGSGSSPQTASVSVAAGTLSRRIFQAVGAATTVAQTTGTIGPSGSWVSSPQTEIAKSQLSASTSIPVTAESNSILPTTAGADNSAANTMSATFSKTLSPSASLAWATVGTAILASGSGVTITKGSANSATQLEPQRAIWQNPRGQKAFYAIVQQGGTTGGATTGLHLYKSTDGSTWTDVVQLLAGSTGTATYSASAYPYDDGTQLVVYVCYAEGGGIPGSGTSKAVYYRRFLIPDGTDSPTDGGEQNTGVVGAHCNIARDRNGYVHILEWGSSSASSNVRIFGTATTNPGDSPTWSAVTTVTSHAGSTTLDDTSAIAVFGGTGTDNILGIVGQHRSSTPNIIFAINIESFNPAAILPNPIYSLGTEVTIESGGSSYHPLDVVVDANDYAHLVFHDSTPPLGTPTGLRYTKATAANTVESWDLPITNIDGVAPDSTSLSIDKSVSPNRLYVFYQKTSADTIFWRTKTVSSSDTAWSDPENSIVDGSGQNLDWIQSGRQLQQCVIPLMYTTQTSFMARFVKFTGTSCTATLTVIKRIINDKGGTATLADFTLMVDGGTVANYTSNVLNTGLHTVSETGPSGYAATFSAECPGGSITLYPGDIKSCTITNDDIPPQLTVKKHVVNDDGKTKIASDFTVHVKSGGSDVTGSPQVGSETGTIYILDAGTYVVSEDTPPTGYQQTGFSDDCDSAGTVTLAVGETKTCTITNDDIPPDACTALGGTIAGTECQISTSVTKSGSFTLDMTLHILGGGKIATTTTGLTLNINGDLIIDLPSGGTGSNGISGDVSGASATGVPIVITTTGDIVLHGDGTKGAQISSNQAAGSCSGGKAGDINLVSTGGDITTEPGSKITANGKCPAGEILITAGRHVSIDGLVESAGMLGTTGTGAAQRPGGGPITIKAGCDLNISNEGIVRSEGGDPGADLVHLEGGCSVRIFGLVESTGPGHAVPNNPTNHCNSANRPDKPSYSTACIEVWVGDSLTIDSTGDHMGEVNADTGLSGGASGIGWIDLFARGDISIIGDSAVPFAVHANGGIGVNTDNGGLVTVKSKEGRVSASGLAIQADATSAGGDGGMIVLEAKGDVSLNTASIFARGDFDANGGYGNGGQVNIRSFTGTMSWQNGVGDVQPTGTGIASPGIITLQDCTAGPIDTSGTSFPVTSGSATTPTVLSDSCGGEPALLSYVTLPICQCGTIVVEKQTIPDGDSQLFTFAGDAAGSISDGQQIVKGGLVPGTYTSTESVPDGWKLTDITCNDTSSANPSSGDSTSGIATFKLDPGEVVKCTFTDEKSGGQQLGTIVVEKQTIPDGDSQLFTFAGDAAGSISDGQQIVKGGLVPGTYTSTESVPDGWKLTDITCNATGSSGDLTTKTATFDLAAGEVVKCTFTDTKLAQGGQLEIVKLTVGGDEDFGFTVAGPTPSTPSITTSGGTGTTGFFPVDAGTYTVTESSIPPNWNLEDSYCSLEGNPATFPPTDFEVPPGGSVTCTFKNSRSGEGQPPVGGELYEPNKLVLLKPYLTLLGLLAAIATAVAITRRRRP